MGYRQGDAPAKSVVFWLYLFVLRDWTASAAYQLVLISVVRVTLSAVLQDERITWAFAAGSILILIGVYFEAFRRPSARQDATRPHLRASTPPR